VQVEKEKLPWWRWALEFALGGIRSGFGLFRRNGKDEVGTQTASEAAIAELESGDVGHSTESSLEPDRSLGQQSSPQPEAIKVESDTEKSTVPENIPEPESSLERENGQSEVEASAEEPLEVESSPEPENSLEPDIGPEPESIGCEVESFRITAGADEVSELEIAPILPVEPLEDESPDLAPTNEETALTNHSPQSDDTATRPAHEEPPVPEPVSPVKEPPESEPAPLAKEPPQPEPAPPAKEPPAPKPAPVPESAPAQKAPPALPFHPPLTAESMAAEPPAPERTTAEKVAAALKARGADAEQSPFSVFVGQVYDGPLDLLLDLIRKQDIDIYDIPIAKITAQFLAYVDHLRASDMDVAGDFIYTAALLIHIKSKMLLPRAPVGPEESTEDPRRELVDRLLEHERFKNAAQMLHDKQMLEANTWTNPGVREFREDAGAEPEIAADTTDLVRIFRDILERARNRPILNVEEDSVTVGQMIQFLTRRLTMEDKPVALRRLLSHTHSERALIAMFLGLLELVRLQAILLRQDRQFSEIFVKKNTGFDAVVNEGLASAHDDWR
jgi:segregation and condensation protein A